MGKRIIVVISIVAFVFSFKYASAQEYAVVNLGTLGGNYSSGAAINNAGQIAGESRTKSGEVHGFLFTPENGMVDLGTLGWDTSLVRDMNDLGQVVGDSYIFPTDEYQGLRAFVWTKADGMVPLPSLGPSGYWPPFTYWDSAISINNAGDIVGWSESSWGGVDRAFLWTKETGILDLGDLLGLDNLVAAVDINDSGQVIVYTWYWGSAVFTPGEGIAYLDTLGGNYTFASRINEPGQVVGASQVDSGDYHAFLRTETGVMVDLGTLGGDYSDACDINNPGQVVGISSDLSGRSRAFLWDVNNEMQDLNDLLHPCDGWDDLSEAFAVNDAGHVVGAGSVKGSYRGYIIAPAVPVKIDIKPGSRTNPINLASKGATPVAILSSESFDASMVNPSTVSLSGAHGSHWTFKDVNYDGRADMKLSFPTSDMNIHKDCREAVLTGVTFDGVYIRGADAIRVRAKK